MIFERVDLQRRFTSGEMIQTPALAKNRQRAIIQQHVDAYLAKGGSIYYAENGVSGEHTRQYGYATIAAPNPDKNRKNAGKKSRDAARQSSTIGVGEASKMLGISTKALREMTIRGDGPPCIEQAGGQARFKYLISDIKAYERHLR